MVKNIPRDQWDELIDKINNSWKNKRTNKYMISFADVCSKIYYDEIIREEYFETN